LKRPDEAELVLLAHNAPQFVEDTARETAKRCAMQHKDNNGRNTESDNCLKLSIFTSDN